MIIRAKSINNSEFMACSRKKLNEEFSQFDSLTIWYAYFRTCDSRYVADAANVVCKLICSNYKGVGSESLYLYVIRRSAVSDILQLQEQFENQIIPIIKKSILEHQNESENVLNDRAIVVRLDGDKLTTTTYKLTRTDIYNKCF